MRLLAPSLALALLLASSSAAAVPTAWCVPATTKVRPADLPGTTKTISFSTARNEFDAAIVAIRDSTTPISGISATATGEIASWVRLYRVETIDLKQPSDARGGIGKWPDALVPVVDDLDGTARTAFPFSAAANETRAIWVDILVPPDTAAGQHSGTITVSWSGGSAAIPVTVRVRNFDMPSTPTLRSYYGLDDQSVCRGHYAGDPGCGDGYGPARDALIDRYVRLALDHRITLGGGTFGLYPRTTTGQAAWAPFVARYGPVLNGTAATRLKGAHLTALAGWHLPELTSVQATDAYVQLASKEWLARSFYYAADEPGTAQGASWSSIPPIVQKLHQWIPGMPALVTTTPAAAAAAGVASSVDIYVPIVNYVTDALAVSISDKRRFWIYDSCMSADCGSSTTATPYWPSAMIDHTGARNQAMGWTAYRFGATGILYWQTVQAYNGSDAWTDQWNFSNNGDGDYFYPGTKAKVGGDGLTPVASQRLKMIRAGVQAYELLSMVARAGDPTFAASQAKAVAPDASSFGPGVEVRMATARAALQDRLEALLTPPATTPDGGVAAQPPPADSPVWAIVAALALAGVAGAGALLALRPKA